MRAQRCSDREVSCSFLLSPPHTGIAHAGRHRTHRRSKRLKRIMVRMAWFNLSDRRPITETRFYASTVAFFLLLACYASAPSRLMCTAPTVVMPKTCCYAHVASFFSPKLPTPAIPNPIPFRVLGHPLAAILSIPRFGSIAKRIGSVPAALGPSVTPAAIGKAYEFVGRDIHRVDVSDKLYSDRPVLSNR